MAPASEVPANTTTGTADIDFDPATKKLSYAGLTGPATMAHFPRPRRTRQECPRYRADRTGH